MFALGLIETVGYTTAVSAADAAVKAANVEIIGLEKVIGVSGYVGVTIHLKGDVAAVASAVEAGRKQGEMIGEVISSEVIPRAHSEVSEKLLKKYLTVSSPKPIEEINSIHHKEKKTRTKRDQKNKTESKMSPKDNNEQGEE